MSCLKRVECHPKNIFIYKLEFYLKSLTPKHVLLYEIPAQHPFKIQLNQNENPFISDRKTYYIVGYIKRTSRLSSVSFSPSSFYLHFLNPKTSANRDMPSELHTNVLSKSYFIIFFFSFF
jgi:hypothetical protein